MSQGNGYEVRRQNLLGPSALLALNAPLAAPMSIRAGVSDNVKGAESAAAEVIERFHRLGPPRA
jgi:hypothetical protein